ncbi:hypothetical protein [Sphingobium sp. KCTC 72723]|uniref:hypothetical protein n=1 Tax=Sphingobium sp. KCTC 72723 TaxID=2733867 RepID=UPI00165E56FD|nr:hypothetical protein [Sphingobium sp. KCTC 72723]
MTPPVSGRPLRFFFLLMAGWIAVRIASQPGLPPAAPVRLATASAIVLSRSQPTRLFPIAVPARNLAMATLPAPPRRLAPRSIAQAAINDQATIDLLKFISFSVAFANRHHGGNSSFGVIAHVVGRKVLRGGRLADSPYGCHRRRFMC